MAQRPRQSGWRVVAKRMWLLVRIVLGLVLGAGLFDRVMMPWVVRHQDEAVVPSLLGKTREEAEGMLRDAGLVIGATQDVSHLTLGAGEIAAQEPAAGARVRNGRAIHLLISSGLPARQIPALTGKTLRHARLELSPRGLQPGQVTLLQGSRHPEGQIVATRPCRGSVPARGGRVDLLVGGRRGQEVYVMPDVRGWDRQRAAVFLRKLGLRVMGGDLPGRVGSQDPAAGEPVWSGARVLLD
jgi:beta-lactam-binding protein with PASTA domain